MPSRVAAAVCVLLLSGCFRLPETADATDPTAVDEASLEALTSLTDLGICTEDGWSGTVVNGSTHLLDATIAVDFLGVGSDSVGTGTQIVRVDANDEAPFTVVPDPAAEAFALSCTIDLAELRIVDPASS